MTRLIFWRAVAAKALMALIACSAANVQAGESRYIRNEAGRAKVVIFVHGVLGDGATTWLNVDSKAYWPTMMSSDKAFADANVYVFEFPSAPVGRSLSVNELAESMRRRLLADKVLQHRELIFLSHSMGGLVTRAFLLKYRGEAAKVRMAYFFATPTEGSPTAVLASLASQNAQFKGMYPLQSDNYLADLQRDWLAARLGIRSFCAYEGKTTFGFLIVDQRSATNLCTEPLDPISEDHVGIVKPKNTNADAYVAFRNAYETVAQDKDNNSSGGRTQTGVKIEATYQVCKGELRSRCPTNTVHLTCRESVAEWAQKECSSYSEQILSTGGGNKCGYIVTEIKCIAGR